MTWPVVLGHEAEREFDEAADWYEARAGLGAEFTRSVREVLDRIGRAPERHATIEGDIRRARVRRFSYNIFFLPGETRPGGGHRHPPRPPRSVGLEGPGLMRTRSGIARANSGA